MPKCCEWWGRQVALRVVAISLVGCGSSPSVSQGDAAPFLDGTTASDAPGYGDAAREVGIRVDGTLTDSGNDGNVADASTDAGVPVNSGDAAPGVDATSGMDAAPGVDATSGMDAAPGVDATSGMDAAPGVDATSGMDAAADATDAGTSRDAGSSTGISCQNVPPATCECMESTPGNSAPCSSAQVGGTALCCAQSGWPSLGTLCACKAWGCSGTNSPCLCSWGTNGAAASSCAPSLGTVCCASGSECECLGTATCAGDGRRSLSALSRRSPATRRPTQPCRRVDDDNRPSAIGSKSSSCRRPVNRNPSLSGDLFAIVDPQEIGRSVSRLGGRFRHANG